jgi:hypothetical protein
MVRKRVKTFYTERDIEEIHGNGVTAIAIDDNVVLTDLARDRAHALGISLVSGVSNNGNNGAHPPAATTPPAADIVALVKARVIARLGTEAHNHLLDQIIPQVLARLTTPPASSPQKPNRGGY